MASSRHQFSPSAGNEPDIEMPTAIGSRLADAQSDVREARELCNSGHPEEGIPMLRGVLNSLHENE